jgi:hypothetical protein
MNMQHWETIHQETRNGFDIVFSVAPEDMHPGDSFDPACFDIRELCEDIDRGRYAWFIARVQAFRAGVELAADYLGGCLYDSPADFVKAGDYYADMVETVTREAQAKIEELYNHSEN